MTSILSAEPAAPTWLQGVEEGSPGVSGVSSPQESARGSEAQHTDEHEDPEEPAAGALIVHSASAFVSNEEEQPQDQLELLLGELGRIETQQEKLRDAVKHNKQIVVHPRQEVLEETDSEYDTPKAPTPKKKLVVSGGLTGFGIAQDLLQIDFSPPEEAPEEFRAVAFFEESKEIKPGLSGSFGLCDPASKEMHHYLERLEEQQRLVLELITGKKQQLLEQYGTQRSSQNSRQGSKLRPTKSRLSRNTRFADNSEKAAVASALGLSTGDKMSSLGNKMGSLSRSTKASLAAKLPMMGLTDTPEPRSARDTRNRPAGRARPPSTTQGRQSFQMAQRKAQVQAEELVEKEIEEIKSQFAEPMIGTTPSTQHLAGKKGAKERAAKAAAAATAAAAALHDAEEASAAAEGAEPSSASKAVEASKHHSIKVRAGGAAGRVSTLGGEEEEEPQTPSSAGSKPSSVFRGLKKMLKGKAKA